MAFCTIQMLDGYGVIFDHSTAEISINYLISLDTLFSLQLGWSSDVIKIKKTDSTCIYYKNDLILYKWFIYPWWINVFFLCKKYVVFVFQFQIFYY